MELFVVQSLGLSALKDGLDKVIINRDDASGFRLDTTYTQKQHRILQEKEKPELTTRTDFVNNYKTVLQTTSYLLMETENTSNICIGLVKPQKLIPKNPAQHAADLSKVSSSNEAKTALQGKQIDCIRVDGSVDEGPSHLEIQFNWTERHLQEGKACTVVSTRYSGGRYLNKVELQNSCLALGHSYLFIPSTIHGTNLDDDKNINQDKLKQNMETAIDVYINSVSGSPCFGTKIVLIKGANEEEASLYHSRRKNLLRFLRGSKKQVEELKRTFPVDFKCFLKI